MAKAENEDDVIYGIIHAIAFAMFAAGVTLMLAATQTWGFDLPRRIFLTASLSTLVAAIGLEIIRTGAIFALMFRGEQQNVAIEKIAFCFACVLLLVTMYWLVTALWQLSPCMSGSPLICTATVG